MLVRFINIQLAACVATLALAGAALGLEPDQIALVVNSQVKASRSLAEYYAAKRHIPDGHIIEVSIPMPNPSLPADDLSPADYDAKILPAVRNFLIQNGLDHKVTCLVTCWGMPLRIARRTASPNEKQEAAELKRELDSVHTQLENQVKAAEDLAIKLNPDFHTVPANDLDMLARRAESALNSAAQRLSLISDPAQKADGFSTMMGIVRQLAGQAAADERLSQPAFAALAPKAPTAEELDAARARTADIREQIKAINSGPQDPAARSKMRDLFRRELGTLNLARLIVSQQRAEDDAESEAALDSELALLWWPPYPKARWAINPLNWKVQGRMTLPEHTLMVMRLDGPTEQSVRDLIDTSIRIENEGLKGEVVLDARGLPATEPYGQYDQTIRNLADLLRQKTQLKVVLDDRAPLIPADSEKDIALYCGWYRLHHFVSPGQFNAGSVGFHVASAEMLSLHNPAETGWAVNLLKAGETATLGPVAEPYLQSFPPADEFFPLLLTGKLPLAEVYWKTTPWASWMQCCVGDPLYRPYRTNPALKKEDLAAGLSALIP